MHEPSLKLSDVKPLSQNQVGLAVLGFPINHSISPQLHNAALNELSKGIPNLIIGFIIR